MFKRIKDKCPFYYKTDADADADAKKNDDIVNACEDAHSQELQFLLERCDLDSETSATPNAAKKILEKILQ